MTESSTECITPSNDSKRRLEFSPLCSRSRSEGNILYPLAKRPNRKSFIEMLDSVSDDAKNPEKIKARQMQQKKTHLAKSMLELRCRRVLPMLMRRKKIINKAENKSKLTTDVSENGEEDKENKPQLLETLSDKVKVMRMQDNCSKSTRNSLIVIL
ncbi:uncharacterized protein LOC134815288 [Bolinopsis microptera]|uniref:uncharacterized protein LOC134815288 n=1 Tax=Bolinopsis microptera TaxID=2820187 RepID=UPI00307A5AF0